MQQLSHKFFLYKDSNVIATLAHIISFKIWKSPSQGWINGGQHVKKHWIAVKGVLNSKHAHMLTMHERLEWCNSKNIKKGLLFAGGVCTPAELEGAVLPSQNVIHFVFPFRFEEHIEEDRNHHQEAGRSHRTYYQPCKSGVCKERNKGESVFSYRGHLIIAKGNSSVL